MLAKSITPVLCAIATVLLLSACRGADEMATESSATPGGDDTAAAAAGATDERSAGKPTAPVSIRYEIVGSAVVGKPVGINLQVAANDPGMPVTLHYRANDPTEMTFPASQSLNVEMRPALNEGPRLMQVIVVPQREGRLYLNVSAEVQTENGAMFRSIAIPVRVGAAPGEQAVNGQLEQTAEGETVVSMPAKEE